MNIKEGYLTNRSFQEGMLSLFGSFGMAQLGHIVGKDKVLPSTELLKLRSQFNFCSFLLFIAGTMSIVKTARRMDKSPWIAPK